MAESIFRRAIGFAAVHNDDVSAHIGGGRLHEPSPAPVVASEEESGYGAVD